MSPCVSQLPAAHAVQRQLHKLGPKAGSLRIAAEALDFSPGRQALDCQ